MAGARSRGRWALALGALVVVAGCSGGASPAPSTSVATVTTTAPTTSTPAPGSSTSTGPAPSKGVAVPTLAERTRALAVLAAGDRSSVVRVPGGYEAATVDQRGGIRFWRDPTRSTTWTQIGSSRYPYVPAIGSPHATLTGALLAGMTHPTWIVRGIFTGDGSGNAVAFTDGSRGWGVIKAETSGNIGPSGAPVGSDRIGLSYGFAFAGGELVTADCPTNLAISECDTHQIRKHWRWNGTDFSLVG